MYPINLLQPFSIASEILPLIDGDVFIECDKGYNYPTYKCVKGILYDLPIK